MIDQTTQLLYNLRSALNAAGISRTPTVGGTAYPLWIDPRNGVPAPGEGKPSETNADCVLGAFQVSGIPRGSYEDEFLRIDAVDIWVRARIAPIAYDVDERIHAVLGDKRAYTLGVLPILESKLFRPLQRLGSDEDGYVFTTQYTFERVRS